MTSPAAGLGLHSARSLSSATTSPFSRLDSQRRLSDPTLPGIAPNVDTLYSVAWLDLGGEPFVLESPDFGFRSYTLQMGCGDTSTHLSLGARTHGAQLPPVFISGPNDRTSVPPGMRRVACPTRYLQIAGRILVRPDDPDDYDAVYDLQSRIRLRTLSGYLAGEVGPSPVPEQRLLHEASEAVETELVPLNQLGNVLRDWIDRPGERRLVDSFAAIAVTPEHGFRPDSLDAAAKREIARGLRFGDDFLLRAAVAKDQIYVTVPEEALYPVARVDATDRSSAARTQIGSPSPSASSRRSTRSGRSRSTRGTGRRSCPTRSTGTRSATGRRAW